MNTRERYLAVMAFPETEGTLLWGFGYREGTVQHWLVRLELFRHPD